MMKRVHEKAIRILEQNGSVILLNAEGENKVVHNLKDLKAAFKLAERGVTDEWVDAKEDK